MIKSWRHNKRINADLTQTSVWCFALFTEFSFFKARNFQAGYAPGRYTHKKLRANISLISPFTQIIKFNIAIDTNLIETFKKIAWVVITCAVCIALSLWFLDILGFSSPTFALLLNWMVMTAIVMVDQKIDFYLPANYFRLKDFEGGGKVYEWIGIRQFKWFFRYKPLSQLNPELQLEQVRTGSKLPQLYKQMCNAETAHVYIFVLILCVSGYALLIQSFSAALWILIFNILFNGYPVILQRYNRSRIHEIISKLRQLTKNESQFISNF